MMVMKTMENERKGKKLGARESRSSQETRNSRQKRERETLGWMISSCMRSSLDHDFIYFASSIPITAYP